MRSIRSAGPRILAASALAVTLAVGAGVGAPTASAGVRPSCGWQALTLLNGWQSEQSAWNTGDPAYCVAGDGMVYLSGSLAQPGGGSNEFAALPQWAWPASVLYLSVYTYAGSVGVVQVNTDGTMYAYNMSADNGEAAQFTSLAGVSFPAAGTSLQPLSLEYGWQSAQGSYDSGDPSYAVSNGIVHLAGSMTNSVAAGHFSVMPAGARPTDCLETNVYQYGGTVGLLSIDPISEYPYDWPAGDMFTQDENDGASTIAAQFTSLAGVSYPVAGSAWQPLSLMDGWQPSQSGCASGAPAYYISYGVVYLDGTLARPGAGSAQIAVLPSGARPTHDLYLTVSAEGLPYCVLRIDPSGAMYLFPSAAGGVPTTYASLGGISYHLGS